MVEEKTLYAFLFPKTVPPISLNAIQQCRAPYDAPGTTTYRDLSSSRDPSAQGRDPEVQSSHGAVPVPLRDPQSLPAGSG